MKQLKSFFNVFFADATNWVSWVTMGLGFFALYFIHRIVNDHTGYDPSIAESTNYGEITVAVLGVLVFVYVLIRWIKKVREDMAKEKAFNDFDKT